MMEARVKASKDGRSQTKERHNGLVRPIAGETEEAGKGVCENMVQNENSLYLECSDCPSRGVWHRSNTFR